MRSDASDWLRLCLVPGIPGASQRALLTAFGTPGDAIGAPPSALAAVAGPHVADALAAGPAPALLAATLSWLDAPGRHLLALGDDDYPRALLEIPDPPTLLDALGDRDMAMHHYEQFKRTHVAQWGEQWSITAEAIQFFVLSQVTREEAPAALRFPPGTIVATPGVLRSVPSEELLAALGRHLSGDWGELDEHDWRANDSALQNGTRLLSAYVASNSERFWIITEGNRDSTTSLLPDEY